MCVCLSELLLVGVVAPRSSTNYTCVCVHRYNAIQCRTQGLTNGLIHVEVQQIKIVLKGGCHSLKGTSLHIQSTLVQYTNE